jgi:spore coat polysaccharide biosynthesis protein SpsF
MGSTRLPGKVLMDIEGEPMLARVARRASQATAVHEVVIATSTQAADDAIDGLCAARGWPCFRGSEDDVLSRYRDAALRFRAEVVVRITADCPLVDPPLIDEVVALFHRERADYASNVLQRSYPRGLDCEAMTMSALEVAAAEATLPFERAHVTPFLYRNPQRFRLASLQASADLSRHRWTVDTVEDLKFVRAVYSKLGPEGRFGWREVLDLVQRMPELPEINRSVEQKGLAEG